MSRTPNIEKFKLLIRFSLIGFLMLQPFYVPARFGYHTTSTPFVTLAFLLIFVLVWTFLKSYIRQFGRARAIMLIAISGVMLGLTGLFHSLETLVLDLYSNSLSPLYPLMLAGSVFFGFLVGFVFSSLAIMGDRRIRKSSKPSE